MSSRSSRPPTRTTRTTTERPLRSPGARGRAAPPPRARRWRWPAAAVAVIVVLVGGFFIVRAATRPNLDAVVTYANLARDHKTGPISYPETPPVGGPHNEVWQNCGIYDKPVANENAVHSLEHGAVWITYRPDLSADQVEQLRKLVRGHGHVLLSPYPNLPAPVVASAWGVQLKIESSSNPAFDPRLPLFIEKYEQGTQTPEPGASCSNGTGSPIEQ